MSNEVNVRRLHAIQVERAAEMIDLVLKYSRVPSSGFDLARFGIFVQEFDANCVGARYHGRETGQAEAALEEVTFILRHLHDSRIDQDVKRHGMALFLEKILRRESFQQLLAIFDDRQLQGESDLGSGETNAGRVVHGLLHVANESLRFLADNFLWGEGPRGLP